MKCEVVTPRRKDSSSGALPLLPLALGPLLLLLLLLLPGCQSQCLTTSADKPPGSQSAVAAVPLLVSCRMRE
ncbi:hypothetical protein V8C86DRAFT_2597654 [Haematococcus lacustris]